MSRLIFNVFRIHLNFFAKKFNEILQENSRKTFQYEKLTSRRIEKHIIIKCLLLFLYLGFCALFLLFSFLTTSLYLYSPEKHICLLKIENKVYQWRMGTYECVFADHKIECGEVNARQQQQFLLKLWGFPSHPKIKIVEKN